MWSAVAGKASVAAHGTCSPGYCTWGKALPPELAGRCRGVQYVEMMPAKSGTQKAEVTHKNGSHQIQIVAATMESTVEVSQKLKLKVPHDPEIAFLGI